MTVLYCWLKYESSRLLYVQTTLISAYCIGVYVSCANDRERVIAIAKTEYFVMSIALVSAAYKYGHAEHFFRVTQFDANEGGFIVPFPASFMEKASSVGLSRRITLRGADSVMCLLALKRSVEIDWDYHVEDLLPFFGHDF